VAVVLNVKVVSAPAGVPSTTPDIVFGGTYGGFNYMSVRMHNFPDQHNTKVMVSRSVQMLNRWGTGMEMCTNLWHNLGKYLLSHSSASKAGLSAPL